MKNNHLLPYLKVNIFKKNMKQQYKIILSALTIGVFIFMGVSSGGEENCGCSTPSVTIPNYADSWDDKEENWEYKECAIALSDIDAEKIHVYVYHNSKMNKYRCELKYSYPGTDCSSISKSFGMEAISTADISESDFTSGDWKIYNYWLGRQM
jgi:hypothetical protein